MNSQAGFKLASVNKKTRRPECLCARRENAAMLAHAVLQGSFFCDEVSQGTLAKSTEMGEIS
ncbi:MAG: hypothetical protein WB566_15460, partial [Terriglobales bacterium]